MTADVPPPPAEPEAVLAWAEAHRVAGRLDDVIVGDGPPGTFVPGRPGESFTYRELLVDRARRGRERGHDAEEVARRTLHRLAALAARARAERRWLDEHGRTPEDPMLAEFLERLEEQAALVGAGVAARPDGTYEPAPVSLAGGGLPALVYEEAPLVRGGRDRVRVTLSLVGWREGAWRWSESGPVHRHAALGAFADWLRDPRAAAAHEELAAVLRTPAWQHTLGALDEGLSALAARESERTEAQAEERVAFRVVTQPGTAVEGPRVVAVEAVLQRRTRAGGFGAGARLDWWTLAARRDLTPADRRVVDAHQARTGRGGEPASTFAALRALADHPLVFLDREPARTRLDIRAGRLRLAFASTPDGRLQPHFQLAGVTFLPDELVRSLRQDAYLVHLHRTPDGVPQVLLAELTAPAAALARAFALHPGDFPPESHDALAARLEPLQEALDVEFPTAWTRTLSQADARVVARLELLGSGAIEISLGVRPVPHGPLFPPGEGPALVLEGRGRDRHGARRDRAAERHAAHALVERLGLGAADETAPWRWRADPGDAAMHLVATLAELGESVVAEWADQRQLLLRGEVGRRHMFVKVADREDWFELDGGAKVEGEVVPLSALLAAIRDDRRYVTVGAHGFARIEERLREALVVAEAATSWMDGTVRAGRVATDAVADLVEEEAQLAASAAFTALRRRIAEGAGERPRLDAALDRTLRPYQRAGVDWMARLAHWGAGAVLADEMGLGKTLQTLAVLVHRAARGPALVVAPTSVVPNWPAEAARFTPGLRVRLYRGPARADLLRDLGPGDVLVASYTVATLDADRLAAHRFATLVLDEAQAVKNASTERARALRGLDAGWRLALTGTPIENHLGELWSLFRVISPGLLGDWESFRARWAIPIEKFGDRRRGRALARLLRPYVLRRMKADVAPELPARTEIVRRVRLSPDEARLYDELRDATIAEVEEAKKNPDRDGREVRFLLLAALTRLRQLCCHPRLVHPRSPAGSTKAALLLELLQDLREGGHRTLVFSQFRRFLDMLAPRLRQHGLRVLVLDGTTPPSQREERIAAFQRGEADVFLISLKAGGFGLNLTAADTVVHLDPWWNPAVEDQATARAHRIGQHLPVTAVRLVAEGTVEEGVLGMHETKRALAAGVLEGTDVAASLDSDELVALIRGAGALHAR